jgi:GT2 family glycosyltransferase
VASVDVVVPSYNYARFLPRCIRSLLSQEGVDVRVLIIDDCSTDDTPSVAVALVAEDSRVEYRRHEHNIGHIATYNEGLLGWARADYSLLISADDLLAPGALRIATRILDANPTIGMCYGMAGIVYDDDDPVPDPRPELPPPHQVISSEVFLQRCFLSGNPVPTPTAFVRTRVQQAIGGYDPALPHSGDLEMWMRFATQGPIGIVNGTLGYYRKHQSSMSVQYYTRLLSDRQEVVAACEHIAKNSGTQFDRIGKWEAGMRARVATDAFWAATEAFSLGHNDKYRACMEFARMTWPAITSSRDWWKMRLKALLGRQFVAKWGSLRAAPAPAAPPQVRAASRQIGWWPAV